MPQNRSRSVRLQVFRHEINRAMAAGIATMTWICSLLQYAQDFPVIEGRGGSRCPASTFFWSVGGRFRFRDHGRVKRCWKDVGKKC
jgi:hypothetical protein